MGIRGDLNVHGEMGRRTRGDIKVKAAFVERITWGGVKAIVRCRERWGELHIHGDVGRKSNG